MLEKGKSKDGRIRFPTSVRIEIYRNLIGTIRKLRPQLQIGFCMVECFSYRQFDRITKQLRIAGCIQCGRCLQLKFCMGWRHRFWRRIIEEN